VAGHRPDTLALAGGVARSAAFVQIVSDVVGLPVSVGAAGDATALGAAICAGVAAGLFSDAAAGARQMCAETHVVQPRAEHVATYADLYAAWQQQWSAHAEADDHARTMMLPAVLQSLTTTTAGASTRVKPGILVTADMDETTLATLGQLGTVEYASFRKAMRLLTGDDLVAALAGKQVFVTEIDIVDTDALQRLPDLRVLAACRGNAVNVDLAACTAFGIPVLFAPGRNADAVAER
jgi:autoinducer 2 (AI-2) kinase